MADILIRGMEMPKDCGHCRFAVDGWCYAYGGDNTSALANDGKTNFCPLVPLPAEHGRLIDADVRPVVRGEWLEPDDDYGYIVCSACEERSPNYERSNFCPYCGADMRGYAHDE